MRLQVCLLCHTSYLFAKYLESKRTLLRRRGRVLRNKRCHLEFRENQAWPLINGRIIARPFFSRPLFLISWRCPPLRLPSLCIVSLGALGDWSGTPLDTIFAHVSRRTEIWLISDDRKGKGTKKKRKERNQRLHKQVIMRPQSRGSRRKERKKKSIDTHPHAPLGYDERMKWEKKTDDACAFYKWHEFQACCSPGRQSKDLQGIPGIPFKRLMNEIRIRPLSLPRRTPLRSPSKNGCMHGYLMGSILASHCAWAGACVEESESLSHLASLESFCL
ncbi:hypothetical protein ACQKWADRAFT_220738 [Trichoderma austrokoningii]